MAQETANSGSAPSSGARQVTNPALRSSSSSNMLPRIQLMRACYGGTETMRQMGETFLPKFTRETTARYDERLKSTFALNKLREAVEAASAKPFKNLITLTNADPDLEGWMWDADLCGHHMHIVAHQFFNTAVLAGLAHILIDFPTTVNLPNLAVQKGMNVRPFMRMIRPEDLLACYYERVGGEQQVAHARISSSRVSYDPNTFKEIVFDQVFVIERGVVQLWERPRQASSGMATLSDGAGITSPTPITQRYSNIQTGGGRWGLVSEQQISVPKVPLVTMAAGDQDSDFEVRPIFMDLAYKQIEHWQSTSEQRNILTATRFPMLACSGVNVSAEGPEGEGFEIGPWKILTSPDAQGKWYFVEHEGEAIAAGARDLETLEKQMDMLSLNPVVSQPGRQYVSMNERSIMEARTNTVVHDLAIECRDAIETAIQFMGMWTGRNYTQVGVNMNFDFSGTDEKAKQIASILDAVKAQALSREGAIHELKRLQLVSEGFDIEAELLRPTVVPATASVDAIEKPTKEDRDFPAGQTRPKAQV